MVKEVKKKHKSPNIVTYFIKNINLAQKEQNYHDSRHKSTLKDIVVFLI